MRSINAKTIAYWTTTGIIALIFILRGAADVANPPSVVAFMAHLGYPAYFAPLIGAWKVLGGFALIAPRFCGRGAGGGGSENGAYANARRP